MAHKGPSIVHEMADKFPLIDLHLTSSMRDTLIDSVLNYKLDAAFIPAPVYNEELKQIHVNDERIVAVTPIFVKNLEDLLEQDRKSTRLNSSHVRISYAVFCLK